MTLYDWIMAAEKRLHETGIESAHTEAILLARHVLRKERAYILAHPFEVVAPTRLEPLLERRLCREPLAYILGSWEFFGRPFNVNPSVLIPRPETETLVEAALEAFPAQTDVSILDVGTGSGCLAITLKLERPGWEVTGSDISAEALKVAQANAEALGADTTLVLSDLFQNLKDRKFDLIVSNPPYIREGEDLQPEVGQWEPRTALFAGHDGMDVYWRLSAEAKQHLCDSSLLLVEVGDGRPNEVAELFQDSGWTEVLRRRDLLGHDRVLGFRFGV